MKMNMSRLNVVAMGAAILFVLASAAVWLSGVPAKSKIGGPFALIDHHGRSVSERDYLGKPTLVFFGFTSCPDICPTTLFELTKQLEELGPDADHLNVVFITVDPERDTPQQLALYLSSFDPRIVGLSGARENISVAMRAYRVYARKVPLEGGDYTMDHTAAIYMMNGKGQFAGVMDSGEPKTTARAKLRRLIEADGPVNIDLPVRPLQARVD